MGALQDYLTLLEATIASLSPDENPYLAITNLLSTVTSTITFPGHFRTQLLVLSGGFGLGLGWIVLWLATWSITLSHLIQRQLEGTITSRFASPAVVNSVPPVTLAAFLATNIPLTARMYVKMDSGLSELHQATAQLVVMGDSWKEGDAFSLANLAPVLPTLQSAGKSIQSGVDNFTQLLYALIVWTLVLVITSSAQFV
ncbi:hypothetical protein MNV49_006462 [Pseudohyphozyma bogoriensis]|nr:hypothetical protein MNV49_006462 [Pseudohyphozyma bogoriensis]